MITELQRQYIINRLNDKDVNITELSKDTGLSKVSLYNIKNGKQIPSERTYQQIIEFSDRNLINTYNTKFFELANEMRNILKTVDSDLAVVVTKNNVAEFKNFKIIK